MSKKKMVVKVLVILVSLFMLSVPSAMAQNFCKGDFTYDGDVDAADVTTFLEHFGRDQYYLPCPPDGPAPVEKTGQTTCYDSLGTVISCSATGQDGEYQKGVAWPNPRFTDNMDGTVTDNLTGLMWLKNANCMATSYPGFDNDGIIGDGGVTWQHGIDFVAGINDGSYSVCGGNPPYNDWRLPHVRELNSLTDYGTSPSLPSGHPFDNVKSEFDSQYYWSSTTLPEGLWPSENPTANAFTVHFYWVGEGRDLKINPNHVWPVRGGQ